MIVPQSAPSHEDYPFLTLGGGDMRWVNPDDYGDLKWVGGLMSVCFFIIAFKPSDTFVVSSSVPLPKCRNRH